MIGSDVIDFGEYRLLQDTELFCYGTDAVLPAAFVSEHRFDRNCKICDVCKTGTRN